MEPASPTPKIRVMIADSSRINTQLLCSTLGQDPDLEVICWDSDPATLMPTALSRDVDVLAVSSNWNGNVRDGIDVVRELSATSPRTKVVILLDSQNNELVLDSLRVGARGIFKKDSSLEMLRKCLHAVHGGEIWIEGRDLAYVIDALASIPSTSKIQPKRLENLSQRECQVLDWLVQGLSNREIAERMGLSQHTIKNYVFHIFDKMGVSNRLELLFFVLSDSKSTDLEVSNRSKLPAMIEEAKKGSLGALVALAEAYAKQGRSAGDAANACKWYRIASERIAEAQTAIAKALTPTELAQCEKEATLWLAKVRDFEAKVVPMKSAKKTRAS